MYCPAKKPSHFNGFFAAQSVLLPIHHVVPLSGRKPAVVFRRSETTKILVGLSVILATNQYKLRYVLGLLISKPDYICSFISKCVQFIYILCVVGVTNRYPNQDIITIGDIQLAMQYFRVGDGCDRWNR